MQGAGEEEESEREARKEGERRRERWERRERRERLMDRLGDVGMYVYVWCSCTVCGGERRVRMMGI